MREPTDKIFETGSDPGLSATDVLVGVMRFLSDKGPCRVVVFVMEESEENEFFHFNNARSQAEEVGLVSIGREAIARLDYDSAEG